MFPIEVRQSKSTVKSKDIVKWLKDNSILDQHGNDFDSDAIVRCLRNSLAHFNINVEAYNEEISSIKLWAINCAAKTICKGENRCNDPKCIPTQYRVNDNGEICTFIFSMHQLREFTNFVINHVLGRLPNDICKKCKHKHD